MKRSIVAMYACAFGMAFALLPFAQYAAGAMEYEAGDYWTFTTDGDFEGLSLSGSIKMELTGTEGTGETAVYVIELSGSGEMSGSLEGTAVSGDLEYSGEIKRLVSNFSMVSTHMVMDMAMTISGESMEMTVSVLQTYSPAMDDFIGDDFPGYGGTLVSVSTVTTTTTIETEILGHTISDTDSSIDVVTSTIQVASANQTVVVPAGEFDCYKCTQTLDIMGESTFATHYYSSKVGNYVKSTGEASAGLGLGDTELKAYSYGGSGSGTSSLLSGTNMLVIILVVVAVVVVVVVVLTMRKRGKAQAQMMAPPPEGGVVQPVPPPPPPPPDQPVA